jgi:hypothetical protein
VDLGRQSRSEERPRLVILVGICLVVPVGIRLVARRVGPFQVDCRFLTPFVLVLFLTLLVPSSVLVRFVL